MHFTLVGNGPVLYFENIFSNKIILLLSIDVANGVSEPCRSMCQSSLFFYCFCIHYLSITNK